MWISKLSQSPHRQLVVVRRPTILATIRMTTIATIMMTLLLHIGRNLKHVHHHPYHHPNYARMFLVWAYQPIPQQRLLHHRHHPQRIQTYNSIHHSSATVSRKVDPFHPVTTLQHLQQPQLPLCSSSSGYDNSPNSEVSKTSISLLKPLPETPFDDGQRPYQITSPIYYVNDKPHIGHAYTSTGT